MSNPNKPNLLASIFFHGVSVAQTGVQAMANSSSAPKPRRRKKGGCTPCAAKAEGVRLLNRSKIG
jgi:hypothetical protein